MDFDQIVATYTGERYQAYLGLLYIGVKEKSRDAAPTEMVSMLGMTVKLVLSSQYFLSYLNLRFGATQT